ncbi:MAG: HlyD family secretion protein [Candidatus Tectimicrobiota bacterium]
MRFGKIEAQQSPPFPPVEARQEGARRRGWAGRISIMLLLLLAVLGYVYWSWQQRWIISTGRVVAGQVRVTAPLTGRLASLSVQEGEQVQQGALLATLVDHEIQAELQRAEARLAGAHTRLQVAEQSGLDPQHALRLEAAQRDLNLARERQLRALAEAERALLLSQRTRAVAERVERLFLLRATAREQWDKAVAEWHDARAAAAVTQTGVTEARAAVQGAEGLLARAREALGYAQQKRADEVRLAQSEVRQSRADMAQIQARLATLHLYAPRDGVVSWLPQRVGAVIDPNDVVLTLLDPQDVWIEVYLQPSELVRLHDGAEVWITMPHLPVPQQRGRLAFIYPTEHPAARLVRIGPQEVRSPARLSSLLHTVKVVFADGAPAGVRPEMLAQVRIATPLRP